MHDHTVRDSSLWGNSKIEDFKNKKDDSIRIGIVQSESYSALRDETIYMVSVYSTNGQITMPCLRMTRFGSPYNYEEYTRQTYELKDGIIDTKYQMRYLPGEIVVVASINGGRNSGLNVSGIILGSINHPYRKESLNRKNEVAYISEFNGIETYISKNGEYRQTFRGIQKNIAELRKAPTGEQLPEPEYDKQIEGSYYQFDKNGSWKVSDEAPDDLIQSIMIDKKNGKIEIKSGKTSLIIDKKKESYSIVNKIIDIKSEESFSLTTKKTTVKSTDLFELEAQKIKTKGEWSQEGKVKIKGDTEITGKVKVTGDIDHSGNTKHSGNTDINGNFSTTGQTSLAGGAKPLITDIIVIMGTGNLGAPVVSNATILTTTMTKAT